MGFTSRGRMPRPSESPFEDRSGAQGVGGERPAWGLGLTRERAGEAGKAESTFAQFSGISNLKSQI